VVVYASEKLGLHVTKSAEIAHKRAMQRAGRDNCRPPCGTEVGFRVTRTFRGLLVSLAQPMRSTVRLTHGPTIVEHL
jgi:hypothetical protein